MSEPVTLTIDIATDPRCAVCGKVLAEGDDVDLLGAREAEDVARPLIIFEVCCASHAALEVPSA